ncbi:MAG: hypothetical protein JSU87_07080 [Gemmatimonadota bacterium]|nr:MAG: hypothetical protein JSU87_07080 [Gemmatimonadota bacterium]
MSDLTLFGLALLAAMGGLRPAGKTPQEKISRTEHLEITYPAAAEAELSAFLNYGEGVYNRVDSLLPGALPPTLAVSLESGSRRGEDETGVVVNLEVEGPAEVLFAGQLARVAVRSLAGDAYDLDAFRFVFAGLAAWVAEEYEREAGIRRPRWLWAAYAYMQEATYLEYLEVYERASDELGSNVVTAVGYTLVSLLVERDGLQGLERLLRALARNADLCAALDDSGLDCARFTADWSSALEAEAARHDFASAPSVESDLIVSDQGELRQVDLWVHVRNPETNAFNFFVQYVVNGEQREEVYAAEGPDYQVRIPLGQQETGAEILWDVAVWSDTLQLWVRGGWQNRVVR